MERMAYLSVELVDKHHRFLFRLLSSAGKVRSYPQRNSVGIAPL